MRILLIAVAFALAAARSSATATDLHEFWDSHCREFYGHAGALARLNLKLEGDVLGGRHHKDDLKRFPSQQHMGPAYVDGIYAMLLAQATPPPLFQRKGAGCHQTAAEIPAQISCLEGRHPGQTHQ